VIRRFGERLLGQNTDLSGRTRWWHVVVPVVLCTALAMFRLPPARWNILWAEDGGIFVTDAYRFDPQVFVETYAGYLHIVPRTLSAFAVTVPVDYVPLAMNLLGAIVVGLICGAVFLFARVRIRSTAMSALLALQVVLLPVAGHEVHVNVAYLQWYLMFAAVWAVIVIARARWLIIVQCLTVALAVLSEPLTALLIAPFILVRVLAIRPLASRAHAVTWSFLGSTVIQAIAVVLAVLVEQRRSLSRSWPSPLAFAEDYAGRVGLDSLVGVTGTTNLVTAFGRPALIIGLALVIVLIVAAAKIDRDRRILVIALAAASVCISFVTEALSWEILLQFAPGDLLAGSRYHYTPVLLLFSAYLLGADALVARLDGRRSRWIPVAAAAAIVLVPGAIDYRLTDLRADAPDWIAQLDEASEACDAQPPDDLVRIDIAPDWWLGAGIPCNVIEAR
jgi:hypothetical protein